MFSKTVETAVKRGYAAVAGTAINSIGPATGGDAPSVLVHAESDADVGTSRARGVMEDVLINDDDRLYPAAAGADISDLQLLMPTTDGSLIPATSGKYYCALAVIGAKSGGIANVIPLVGYLKT